MVAGQFAALDQNVDHNIVWFNNFPARVISYVNFDKALYKILRGSFL